MRRIGSKALRSSPIVLSAGACAWYFQSSDLSSLKSSFIDGRVSYLNGVFSIQSTVHAESGQKIKFWGAKEAYPGGDVCDDVMRPSEPPFFRTNQLGWKAIAFGPWFGVALTHSGDIYVWGSVSSDPTKVHSSDLTSPEKRVYIEPFKLNDDKFKLDRVECSMSKIYGLTKEGRAYVWDQIDDILRQGSKVKAAPSPAGSKPAPADLPRFMKPKLVEGLPYATDSFSWLVGWYDKVTKLSVGDDHACFVSHKGGLYCYGDNLYGQCGKEPVDLTYNRAQLIQVEGAPVSTAVPMTKVEFPLMAPPVCDVACGDKHTLIRDVAGNTWSMGDDRKIQLGMGDTRTMSPGTAGVTWKERIAKGDVLPYRGAVKYRWGKRHLQHKPTLVPLPDPGARPVPYTPAHMIRAGAEFSLFGHRDSPDWYSKDDETNVLFACGDNIFGQCGRGRQQQHQIPLQVRMPRNVFHRDVQCGTSHCLSLLERVGPGGGNQAGEKAAKQCKRPGYVYAWGYNFNGQVGTANRGIVTPAQMVGLDEEEDNKTAAVEAKPSSWTPVHISARFNNSAVIQEPFEP